MEVAQLVTYAMWVGTLLNSKIMFTTICPATVEVEIRNC